MIDPADPAKYLLFLWLLIASVLMGVRLTRRFIGAVEPLDVAGYALAFVMLLLGAVGSWVARIVRHFPTTFIVLAALLSLPLVIEWVRRRGRQQQTPSPSPPRPSGLVPGLLSRRERMVAVVAGVFAVLPGSTMIWRSHLWDDWYFYLPLTSAFSRGVFPVVYPFLPDRAVTYHFGFAWIAGLIEYHTGFSPEHCVDIVSTLCLVIFYLSAAGTFRIWVGGRLSPYLGASAVLGFGPLAWLWTLIKLEVGPKGPWFATWLDSMQTTFTDDVARSVDYLLQKPMLAGMALVWVVMALIFAARRRHSVAVAAAAGIAAGMLELFQYPAASLAAVAGSAVFFLDLFRARTGRRERLVMLVVFALLAFALPRLNGGFVANPQGDPIVVDHIWKFPYPGVASYAKAHDLPIFFCYLLYYGASAFVFPLVLPALWRQRSLNTLWVALFVLGGFAIPHVMHHHSSPSNITKFFHLSSFAMATLSAAGILLTTRRWPHRLRVSVLGAFLVAISLTTWLSSLSIGLSSTWARALVEPARVSSLRSMARWLRAHAGTHDRVFALTDEVEAMSGVLSPLPPEAPGGRQLYTVNAHGYAPEYVATIKGLTDSAAASLDDHSLARLRIRWIVLPDPLPPSIGPEARRRLAQPELFPLRKQIKLPPPNGWLIYENLRGPPPGSLHD